MSLIISKPVEVVQRLPNMNMNVTAACLFEYAISHISQTQKMAS